MAGNSHSYHKVETLSDRLVAPRAYRNGFEAAPTLPSDISSPPVSETQLHTHPSRLNGNSQREISTESINGNAQQAMLIIQWTVRTRRRRPQPHVVVQEGPPARRRHLPPAGTPSVRPTAPCMPAVHGVRGGGRYLLNRQKRPTCCGCGVCTEPGHGCGQPAAEPAVALRASPGAGAWLGGGGWGAKPQPLATVATSPPGGAAAELRALPVGGVKRSRGCGTGHHHTSAPLVARGAWPWDPSQQTPALGPHTGRHWSRRLRSGL
jgi:hypothetical protein